MRISSKFNYDLRFYLIFSSLLITKAKLEQVLGNTNQALTTYKEAFTLWKSEKKDTNEREEYYTINVTFDNTYI